MCSGSFVPLEPLVSAARVSRQRWRANRGGTCCSTRDGFGVPADAPPASTGASRSPAVRPPTTAASEAVKWRNSGKVTLPIIGFKAHRATGETRRLESNKLAEEQSPAVPPTNVGNPADPLSEEDKRTDELAPEQRSETALVAHAIDRQSISSRAAFAAKSRPDAKQAPSRTSGRLIRAPTQDMNATRWPTVLERLRRTLRRHQRSIQQVRGLRHVFPRRSLKVVTGRDAGRRDPDSGVRVPARYCLGARSRAGDYDHTSVQYKPRVEDWRTVCGLRRYQPEEQSAQGMGI